MGFFKNQSGKLRVGWKIILVLFCITLSSLIWRIVSNVITRQVYLMKHGLKDISAESLTKALENVPEISVLGTIGYALIILIVFLFVKRVDKNKLNKIGLEWKRNSLRMLLMGIVTALAIELSAILVNLINGGYSYTSPGYSTYSFLEIVKWIMYISLFSIVSGAAEEILFRGYILNNFMEVMPRRRAVLISAIIFVLPDLFLVPKLIYLLEVFAIGVFLAYIYIYTSSLYLTIGFHSFFHFLTELLFRLVDNDALKRPVILMVKGQGDYYLAGIDLGHPSGILVFLITVLAILTLYFISGRLVSSIKVSGTDAI